MTLLFETIRTMAHRILGDFKDDGIDKFITTEVWGPIGTEVGDMAAATSLMTWEKMNA